jgi:hypothetical protein
VILDVGDGRPEEDDTIRCAPLEWAPSPYRAASGGAGCLNGSGRMARTAAARAARRPPTPPPSGGVGADASSRGAARPEIHGGCPGVSEISSLRWLSRHQADDGGWSCSGFSAQCAGGPCSGGGSAEHDVGASGLALLAFLGAGYTHTTRTTHVDHHTKRRSSPGKTVKRGLEWLIARQGPDGCVGPKGAHHLYDHAIATLALSEAWGLTNAAVYKAPAQRAVDYLVAAQNPGLGWRYTPRSGDNDTSVTGWAVMALKSAHISALTVPRSAFDDARAWLDRATDATGLVGYTAPGLTDVCVPGQNDAWRPRPTMTAIGLLSRLFIDRDQRDPLLAKSARLLVADLPGQGDHEVDSYYWYYGSLALFQYQDGGGLSYWKQWNQALKAALVPAQRVRKDGCADGSWDPEVDRWGFAGGRVAVTALNTMSLEVYYRYQRVLGSR